MKVTKEMYTTLFNGITDAIDSLDAGKIEAARKILVDAQQKAESIYINLD